MGVNFLADQARSLQPSQDSGRSRARAAKAMGKFSGCERLHHVRSKQDLRQRCRIDLDLSRFCSGQLLMSGGPLFEGHG